VQNQVDIKRILGDIVMLAFNDYIYKTTVCII